MDVESSWSLRRVAREAGRSADYVSAKVRKGLLRRELTQAKRGQPAPLEPELAGALVRVFRLGIVTDEFVDELRDPVAAQDLIYALTVLSSAAEPVSARAAS